MNIYSASEKSVPGRQAGGESVAAGDLRQILRKKFPEAHAHVSPPSYTAGGEASEASLGTGIEAGEKEDSRIREHLDIHDYGRRLSAQREEAEGGRFLTTGMDSLDAAGLEKGAITEIVGDPRSACGAGLLIAGIVREAALAGRYVALVDGRDVFDPRQAGVDGCRSLLWVRCREVDQALKAADFLLRDGNIPLVLLDLQLACDRELGRVPGSTWFRLRSLAEQTGAPLLAVTPRPLIPCSRLRLRLPENVFGLAAVELPIAELEGCLRPEVLRRRSVLRYGAIEEGVVASAARMAG